MRKLTEKQERFCLYCIDPNVKNASDAYRLVYNAEKMKASTINRRAHELLENGKIRARIEELRAPIIKRAELSLENHLKALEELRNAAIDKDQFSAAITAEHHRGKASGLYIDKIERSGPGGGPIENKWVVEIVKPGEG